MDIYNFLSALPVSRKKYSLKFFVVALPIVLLALGELFVLIATKLGWVNISIEYVIAGVVTLVISETVAMIYFFNRLVAPLRISKDALSNYMTSRQVPQLPLEHDDEAGQLMQQIQATIVQMDELITEKSDMIDLLSHDMRSPIGRIISLANLVKLDDGDKNIYADYINSECKNLMRVLENILVMLREEGHAFKLVSVNLKELVMESIRFFDLAANSKSLKMQVEIDEAIYVNVQHDLFTQAVRNILGNAIKFSPEGKSIYISTAENEDRISLIIEDEGLGFGAGDMNKIFDRFTPAGKKGTKGEASVGLGLYLSRKIIEKHGGKLTAESRGANKGARFTIMLQQILLLKPIEAEPEHVDQQGKLFQNH